MQQHTDCPMTKAALRYTMFLYHSCVSIQSQDRPFVACQGHASFGQLSSGILHRMRLIQHYSVPLYAATGREPIFAIPRSVLQAPAEIQSQGLVCHQDYVICSKVFGIFAAFGTMMKEHFEAALGLVCQFLCPLAHQ